MAGPRSYNSLLQVTNITDSGSRSMNMTYNYPKSGNNGRIASSYDAVNAQTVNYTYDSLNRLAGAQATNGGWGEAYNYDGFGNLQGITPTGQGGETWTGVIDQTTNRLTSVGNYDANGNQIGDQIYTNYVWNVENRMVQQLTAGGGGTWYGGTAYSYDPSGRRVMKNVNPDPAGTNTGSAYGPGTWEFYFYGLNGRKMGTIGCAYNTGYTEGCWLTAENTYLAGKMVVENGSPVATDRLGSVRANGNFDSANIKYFPYGAEQTASTEGVTKFGTYVRDAVGQDYAEQRYYNAGIGRFWSPDPGGIKTADAGNPISWNRYGYAYGDPVNMYDPRGMHAVMAPAGSQCEIDPELGLQCTEFLQATELGAVVPGDDGENGGGEADCTQDSQFHGMWNSVSGFVSAHYSDAGSLSANAGISADWTLAWAAYESGWGGDDLFKTTGNYFSWHGSGDITCPNGRSTYNALGCFSDFNASAMTALYSTDNLMHYQSDHK